MPSSISSGQTDHEHTTPLTLSAIIRQASMQLDGIGLSEQLIAEATAELERNLQRVAALALRKVLQTHLTQLSPPKKLRKSPKSGSRSFSELSAETALNESVT